MFSDQSCVNRTETGFLSHLLYEICENLHYVSVYFKELHNDQELDYEYSPHFSSGTVERQKRERA